MRSKLSIALVLVFSLAMSACATRTTETQADGDGSGSGSGTGDLSNASAVGSGSGLDSDSNSRSIGSGDDDDPLSKRDIYFDYDSSSLTEESRIVVEAHAAYLTENTGLNVSLEGHADERGTREYNLALGERRAQTVARLMNALGVTGGRTQSISYGEERPAVEGEGEDAWAQNRRVRINYE